MSYDIELKKDGEVCDVELHSDGGTYALGGGFEAQLNITYNYSEHYSKHLDNKEGIRWLYGKKAKDCIERLQKAVKTLGTERDEDYWKATEGNAGYALSILLIWAREHPEAIFDGD